MVIFRTFRYGMTMQPPAPPASTSLPIRKLRRTTPMAETPSEPPTLERALGMRVRNLRRNLDLAVSDLASAAGISTGMLSKIENGQISPSLSTVQAIAAALGLPIATLFTDADDRLHCSLVRANQGVTIERRGSKLGHAYQLLGHVLGGEIEVEPYLITLADDAAPHTAFQHAGIELIHMQSGEMIYRHAEAIYELRPGDTLLFDSGALHGPQQILVRPTTYLSIIVSDRVGRQARSSRPVVSTSTRRQPRGSV